jgi:hypothetical protein
MGGAARQARNDISSHHGEVAEAPEAAGVMVSCPAGLARGRRAPGLLGRRPSPAAQRPVGRRAVGDQTQGRFTGISRQSREAGRNPLRWKNLIRST